MRKSTSLEHLFVECLPDELEAGVLYVSIEFATAAHKCCCGCGTQVVTPLSPAGWRVTFDGESVSLYPSIGNWSFACRSHYWIERNRVIWAPRWSATQIEIGRRRDAEARRHLLEDGSHALPERGRRRLWTHVRERFTRRQSS